MTPKQRHKYLLSTAKRRNIEVNLKSVYYDDLIELGCCFCGESLNDKNGVCLDRLENSKGYIENNVAPCCKRCNVAKNNMFDQNEFFTWIEKVYNHMKNAEKRLNSEEYKNISHVEQRKIRNKYMNSSRMRNSETLFNQKK